MLDWWNNLCLAIVDLLLGWSLSLPSDVTLLLVAAISAAILTLLRVPLTNQDRLRRAAADTKRLRQLRREARKAGERKAAARHSATFTQIAMIKLAAEGKPLLAAIVPIAVLATWCALRLEYHPPRADQSLEFVVYTPVSRADKLAHVVPQEGIESSDRWIRRIEPRVDEGARYGEARWKLRVRASDEAHCVVARLADRSLEHNVLVGQPTYLPPVVDHSEDFVTAVRLRPVRLFGVLHGVPQLCLAPWLVAYLVLTIPFTLLIKKVFRIR